MNKRKERTCTRQTVIIYENMDAKLTKKVNQIFLKKMRVSLFAPASPWSILALSLRLILT